MVIVIHLNAEFHGVLPWVRIFEIDGDGPSQVGIWERDSDFAADAMLPGEADYRELLHL